MADLPNGAEDDEEIAGQVRLLRRVPENRVHNGEIEKTNFDEREADHGLSVTVWGSPQDLIDVLRGHENFGVVCVDAEAFRDEEVKIVRTPLEGNPNHCEIFPRLGPKAQRRLKLAARWVRYADWVLPEHRVEIEVF